ncbi:MAG: rRNA maturation RNase YbeY [Bacteroidia bacterium]
MIEFFSDTDFQFAEADEAKLSPVIERIFSDYHKTLNYLHVVFLDDEQLLQINKEFLEHDYYTDIITFNYADEADVIEAELYISVTRVADNAQTLGVTFDQELNRVVIHGVLHLCGYEDNTIELKNEMQLAENKYINLIVSRETL